MFLDQKLCHLFMAAAVLCQFTAKKLFIYLFVWSVCACKRIARGSSVNKLTKKCARTHTLTAAAATWDNRCTSGIIMSTHYHCYLVVWETYLKKIAGTHTHSVPKINRNRDAKILYNKISILTRRFNLLVVTFLPRS